MDDRDDPGIAPASEVVPDILPGRQVVRQVAPLAAGLGLVEDRVPDLAPGILARAAGAALFGFGHHRLQDFPLVIGQIAGVGLPFHSEVLSQFLTLSTSSKEFRDRGGELYVEPGVPN